MPEYLGIAAFIGLLSFGFVVLFGAPYLPTLRHQIQTALNLADLKPGQTLIELGSGDGRVILAAARQGIQVTGYELNPLLALFSWFVTLRYRSRVKIVWGNFWHHTLPEADAIFTFLLPKYMEKLDRKIIQESAKPVRLVSFAFKIPQKSAKTEKDGIFLYLYK